ncbi:MAG: hypothetical protein COA65_06310 [Rhodospirillaceae bacterium]|nr:MAG: hypothetical protein COA65_06310 [Rhodospirillaceae bacterium]
MTELTVGDVRPRVQYTADGTQTIFTYPFPIFDAADLEVFFDDGATPTSHTITGIGNSNGGTVVFDAPPTNSIRITIRRDAPVERSTDFQEGGDFRAAAINEELDKLTMFVQTVASTAQDALRQKTHDIDTDMTLPPVATRANKLLGFGQFGEPAAFDRAATEADPNLGGESNEGLNLGGGEGVFAQKSGVTLRFKSLIAGSGVGLAADANEITLSGTELDLLTTQGDLVSQGVSTPERLALGTVDQVLKVNGAGTNLGWETLKTLAGTQVDFQTFAIATDSAISFTPPKNSGIALAFGLNQFGDSGGALFSWRTDGFRFCDLIANITGVEATTGALTGTTGNTNTVTYSTHTDGKLYIENRLTSTRNIAILLFATDPA